MFFCSSSKVRIPQESVQTLSPFLSALSDQVTSSIARSPIFTCGSSPTLSSDLQPRPLLQQAASQTQVTVLSVSPCPKLNDRFPLKSEPVQVPLTCPVALARHLGVNLNISLSLLSTSNKSCWFYFQHPSWLLLGYSHSSHFPALDGNWLPSSTSCTPKIHTLS